jgi:hypothetical protein
MRVVAYFKSVPALERAAREADRTGWRVVSACSPAFNETLLEAAHATRSPVASAALVGGIAGLVMGLVLTVGTVRQWPGLIVGGKPLVSMPPFLIIMFELTILVAAVAAAWSFLSSAARARRDARGACDATTTDNRFSLLLEGAGADPRRLGEELTRLDACEWRRIDV